MLDLCLWTLVIGTLFVPSVWTLSITQSQYNGLKIFYEQTHGDEWNWLNTTKFGPVWNFTTISGVPIYDPCVPREWQGLTCNCTVQTIAQCNIIGIGLPGYKLRGDLPDSIAEFPSLVYLNLSDNNEISGSFPNQAIFAETMEVIDLSRTTMSGPLPDYLWSLGKLRVFRIWDTFLNGQISPMIGNLTSLVYLNLGFNRFIGSVPITICDLFNLEYLRLEFNFFSGTIYPEISRLSKLRQLHWQGNHLDGTIPSTLANLTKLEHIDLGFNNIEGTIPPFGNPFTLRSAIFADNFLYGRLPVHFLTLPGMTTIDITYNHINHSLPEFTSDSSLVKLILDANDITGTIPECYFTHMPNVRVFSVQSNIFVGTIPKYINRLSQVRVLFVGNNYMTGTIPNSVYDMKTLRILSLLYNFYNGTLSSNVANLTALRVLDVSYNSLTGTIPHKLGEVKNMTRLYLCGNLFHGMIPPELGNMTILRYLLLNENMLTGTVPLALGNLQNLGWFYLSENYLHGRLFELLAIMPRLIDMVMYGNQFTGPLPYNPEWHGLMSYSFGFNFFTGSVHLRDKQVKELVYVDLSKNILSTTIPSWAMTAPFLGYFYINENYVHGTIPKVISASSLVEFWVDANYISGKIPENIGNCSFLQLFRVGYNFLSGTIPASMSSLRFMGTLFLQGNHFTGPIDNVFDPNVQHYLKYVDISENYFTSSIPGRIFANASTLISFAASTNCFSGSIPKEICSAEKLEDFVLDGASTAKRCQRLIFPSNLFLGSSSPSNSQSSSVSRAFILKKKLIDGIPSCLFNMPSLELLHLSGNALTGTIPYDVAISPTLQNLSIANNQLSGSIPVTIQKKQFINLDVSYNKFSGTLLSDVPPVLSNGSFHAERNRLSGHIPPPLRMADDISILQGNLFECDFERNDLPVNDPKSESYNCGSDQINRAVILWVCVWPAVLVFLLLLDRYLLHVIFLGNSNARKSNNISDANANKVDVREDTTWRGAWHRFRELMNLLDRWRNTLYVPLQVLIEEDESTMRQFQRKRSPTVVKEEEEENEETKANTRGNSQQDFSMEESYLSSKSNRQGPSSYYHREENASSSSSPYVNSQSNSDTEYRTRTSSSAFSSTSEDLNNWHHGPLLASVLPPHLLSNTSSLHRYSMNPSLMMFNPSTGRDTSPSVGGRGSQPMPPLSFGSRYPQQSPSRESSFLHRMSSQMVWPGMHRNRSSNLMRPPVASNGVFLSQPTTTVLTNPHGNLTTSFSTNSSVSNANSNQLSAIGNISESSTGASESSFSIAPSTKSFISTASEQFRPMLSSLISERIYILSSFKMMKTIYIGLTIVTLLILLPLYIYFSHGYGTYTDSYIWRLTPMLLSGMEPGYFLFVIFIVILTVVWNRIEYHKTVVLRSMHEYQISWRQLSYYALFAIVNLVALLSVNILYVLTVQNYGSVVLFFSEAGLAAFKVFWNEMVVIRGFPWLKNHYFRYILSTSVLSNDEDESMDRSESKSLLGKKGVSKDSTTSSTLFASSFFSRNVSRPQSRSTTSRDQSRSVTRERLVSTMNRTHLDPLYGRFYDLIVQLTMIIMNLLLMPALATAVANANCFYNILQPPATVAGGFQLASCNNVVSVGHVVVCIGRTAVYETITYAAPFLYTYQCSSFLIINYAAVYVYFVLLVTVVVPLGKALVRLWHYRQRKHRRLQKLQQQRKQPSDSDLFDATNPLHNLKARQDTNNRTQNHQDTATADIRQSSFVIRPTLWQLLPFKHHHDNASASEDVSVSPRHSETPPSSARHPSSTETPQTDVHNPAEDLFEDDADDDSVFDKRQLVIRFLSNLALLLIFGVLFPPMAVIVCLGAMMMMFFEEILFGHVMYDQNHRHKTRQGSSKTDLEAVGVSSSATQQQQKQEQQEQEHQQVDSDRRMRQKWSASYAYRLYLLRQNAEALRYLTNPVMLWILLTTVSVIYAYLLFDTMGDALVADHSSRTTTQAIVSHSVQWQIAVSLSMVTLFWPTVLLCSSLMRSRWRSHGLMMTQSQKYNSWRWKWFGSWGWNVGDVLRQMHNERKVLRERTKRIWEEEQERRRAHEEQQQQRKMKLKDSERKKKVKRQRRQHQQQQKRPFQEPEMLSGSSKAKKFTERGEDNHDDNDDDNVDDNDNGDDDIEDTGDYERTTDRDSRVMRISEMVTIRRSEDV